MDVPPTSTTHFPANIHRHVNKYLYHCIPIVFIIILIILYIQSVRVMYLKRISVIIISKCSVEYSTCSVWRYMNGATCSVSDYNIFRLPYWQKQTDQMFNVHKLPQIWYFKWKVSRDRNHEKDSKEIDYWIAKTQLQTHLGARYLNMCLFGQHLVMKTAICRNLSELYDFLEIRCHDLYCLFCIVCPEGWDRPDCKMICWNLLTEYHLFCNMYGKIHHIWFPKSHTALRNWHI